MKSLIHIPYRSYNRERKEWEWQVEIYFFDLKKHSFKTKEEAEAFYRKEKEND